VLTKYLT